MACSLSYSVELVTEECNMTCPKENLLFVDNPHVRIWEQKELDEDAW